MELGAVWKELDILVVRNRIFHVGAGPEQDDVTFERAAKWSVLSKVELGKVIFELFMLALCICVFIHLFPGS